MAPTNTRDPYRSAETPSGLRPYVSSGRTPILGLVSGLCAGTLAAIGLSVLYAYGTLYIPIVQIEFLLTMAFGALVGASSATVMHRFKVRSRAVVVGTAFLLGVLAWAASWLPWIYGTFQRFEAPVSPADVLNPFFLVGAIPQIYGTGTWSVNSSEAVSGPLLGAVWLVEALTIVVCSTATGLATMKDQVFCEPCDSWCTVLEDRARYDAGAGESVRAALRERGDLSVLTSAPRPSAKDRWLSLKLGFCTGCGETNVLALDEVKQTIDKQGHAHASPKAYLAFHCVSRGDMAELRRALGA
jgi:hypothetical protein